MAGMPFPGEDSRLSSAEQAQAIFLLLSQTETWVDGIGRPHLIENMSVRYKANVIAWLHRRAANLAEMYAAGQVVELAIERSAHGPAELIVVTDEIADDPHAWLSSTPLMMQLLVDVAQGVGGSED
jgi:hypothetical protein